jgi:multidrug efflux system membrane fusion protein
VNTLEGVTLVPAAAIQQNGSASFVYVIQNNVAHMRSVNPGVTDGGVTQVEGINPADVVATSSFDKLQDNVAVTTGNSGENNGGNNSGTKGSGKGGSKGSKSAPAGRSSTP